MKKALADKEAADKLAFEETVKAAAAARKKAAIAKQDVGDDLPTADEAQAAAKAETAKKKTPPAKKTAKDEKVEVVQSDFMKNLPEEKAKEAEAERDAAAAKAASVGDQQERQDKIDKAAAVNTHTTSEIWTANMPSQYLAQ